MADTDKFAEFSDAAAKIKEAYVDKVLDFMSGRSVRVCSNKDYTLIYNIVMN